MATYLRSCATCAAHIVTPDRWSQYAYCSKHAPVRPSFDEWAAGLAVGDTVYLYPVLAGNLSHSRWLITDRDAEHLTVQVIGIPETSRVVLLTQCADRDMTPRPKYGALY